MSDTTLTNSHASVRCSSISRQPDSPRRAAWRRFFGDRPYPFDLSEVEKRDDTEGQLSLVRWALSLSSGPILDAGCGRGRHAAPLAENRRDVVAVDFIFDNCRYAASRANPLLPVVADCSELPFRAESFGIAYSLYTSIGYEPDRDAIIVAELARVLKPGGVLCLDVASKSLLMSLPRISLEGVPKGVAFILTKFDSGNNDVSRDYFVCRKGTMECYQLKLRAYSPSELDGMCVSNGLKVCEVFGSYRREPYSDQSRRCILICRKEPA